MIQDTERCKQDGEFYRAQLGTDKGFLITFDLYTEESTAQGDTEDGGYAGVENCTVDEFDDDGITAVDKAIRFLSREHSVCASSSHFHTGVWYSDTDNDIDYRTGEETQHSYHPVNFTADEQRAIFDAIKVIR
jgi:hypothetical protein